MRKRLENYFKWEFSYDDSEDFYIDVEGKGRLPYEMTLSPDIPDDECMRVLIDGEYYYFG